MGNHFHCWAALSTGKPCFQLNGKSALLVFGVKKNLKAHQLQCNHSTDEESEAREDQAIVLSTGQIPKAGANMSKSILSYA